MSDYLWDKSGESDPEVERLEELFEGLRYKPRDLELPATAQSPARSSRRSWPGLAAATLALMGLAGLWLVQHRQGATGPQPAAIAHAAPLAERTGSFGQSHDSLPAPDVERQSTPGNSVKANKDRAVALLSPSSAQTVHRPVIKRRPELIGPVIERTRPEREAVAAPDQQRLIEQRQQVEGIRAREELMLALQVASTTLNHAQRKAQGGGPAPVPASKPTEPAPSPRNKSR